MLKEMEGHTPETILEVGNVLQNYGNYKHDIVDKYEQDLNVRNADIIDYNPSKKYDLIITISTLEHVGWDETPREPGKLLRAIDHLKTLLNKDGLLVATMPMGHNDELDRLVEKKQLGFDEVCFLKRISANNIWKEASYDEVKGTKYGTPYICANALIVGYFTKTA